MYAFENENSLTSRAEVLEILFALPFGLIIVILDDERDRSDSTGMILGRCALGIRG